MHVVKAYPPNYSQILQYLSPPKDAVFAYGETLYNPSGQDIPQDVYEHELVHCKQMQGWLPDAWWLRYLLNIDFRKSMELEAYAVQYHWVKERVPARIAKLCLSDLASNMATLYNLGITQSQAETLIRKFSK